MVLQQLCKLIGWAFTRMGETRSGDDRRRLGLMICCNTLQGIEGDLVVALDVLEGDESAAHEVSQYAFKDEEHFYRGAQECDRALLCGHLEVVPADEVEWSLAHGSVNPWTVVQQSTEKWRSCQDYKLGTNLGVHRICCHG